MKTIDDIARSLHLKLPMTTQEDAIDFAHRFLAAMKEEMEPVAWHSKFHSEYGAFSKKQIYPDDVPLYKLEDWK